VRGHREDKRRARLSADNRCWMCCTKLSYDDITGGRHRYCAKCRAETEADIWQRYCDGGSIKDISAAVRRPPSEVHRLIVTLERAQEETSSLARNDGIPRCRCGLRIDKDHLVCDLYGGAARLANNRRGGPTYPANG